MIHRRDAEYAKEAQRIPLRALCALCVCAVKPSRSRFSGTDLPLCFSEDLLVHPTERRDAAGRFVARFLHDLSGVTFGPLPFHSVNFSRVIETLPPPVI